MENLTNIAAKLEAAYFYGNPCKLETVFYLVFKQKEMLTEEEEVLLVEWIKSNIKPEKVYISCNRNWQEGPCFKAFLHLENFNSDQLGYNDLVRLLNVKH